MFSEDLLFQDHSGLLFLEYESWLPVLGNLLFSVRRVPDLIDQPAAIDGWHFRGVSTWVGLRRIETESDTVRGFVHLGGLVGGGVLVALGLAVVGAGVVF